jgi:hypothetical protein
MKHFKYFVLWSAAEISPFKPQTHPDVTEISSPSREPIGHTKITVGPETPYLG